MISRFWLGECIWDINVVLWQNFGKEILDFDQVMRLERFGPTVHGRLPSWTGRTCRAYSPGTHARKDEDGLLVEFPCNPIRTRSV
jgi:hypothetical protein